VNRRSGRHANTFIVEVIRTASQTLAGLAQGPSASCPFFRPALSQLTVRGDTGLTRLTTFVAWVGDVRRFPSSRKLVDGRQAAKPARQGSHLLTLLFGSGVARARHHDRTSTQKRRVIPGAPHLTFIRRLTTPIRKGSSTLHLRSLPEPKRAFLGLLGCNSYGTEGAQPVANVRHAERRKMA
jgi:hypothetical protein